MTASRQLARSARDTRRPCGRFLSTAVRYDILTGYTEAELAVVADFLRRTAAAGRMAAGRLSVTR